MQHKTSKDTQEQTAKRAAWYKIVEDFSASGQSQTNYCKQNDINKDHFAYYIGRWRKDKHGDSSESQFVPMEVVKTPSQSKLVLNVESGDKP